MKYKLNRVNTVPESPAPGGVYFENSTGLIKVAQEDGSCKEYGGQGVEIIAPYTPGSISTGGSIEFKVAKGGSTSVIPLFMQWFDGQELLAMEDGEQKTLTAKLYNMLLTFVANGRNYAFFMVKGAVGMTGTSMIPVTVEFNGANTLYVKAVLTCDNDPEKPMISTWSLAVGNVATRADAVIGQSGMTVDTDLSATSTNPVQNKVITAALGDKQGKFCHGGTLQVSSINGNTALSVGSVDAKADYVEVQYTGSSNATFDFNSKFSANWFKDRQDKPQRMMFKNNSSTATVTITTKENGNFAYGFSEIILGSNSSVEFHVYRTIVSVSYGNNSYGRSNDHDAIIKTASVMELSTSYLDSGILPSDIQNRMKEAAVPLIMYHPTYHLRYAASYLWNGEIFCISLVDSQKENTRIINAVYDSTGKWQSKTMVPLGVVSGGTGSKFLNDKGQYVSIPEEVRGTALFFHDGIGQSTVDKGLAVKRTALKPNGITPIAGKDVLVDIQTGIIALITSTDLTNVYCSYDTGTMLNTL